MYVSPAAVSFFRKPHQAAHPGQPTPWTQLRRAVGAPPSEDFIFVTRRSRLTDLRPGEKLLVIRKYGGFGDILILSMLFPDLRDQYPHIDVTFALPQRFFPLFDGTGLALLPYESCFLNHVHDPVRGTVRSEFLSGFDLIEDLSNPCHRWQNLFIKHGGIDGGHGLKWRNRLDMWSRPMGLTVKNPRTIIRITDAERAAAKGKLNRFGPPPHLILAPFTGSLPKNYPWFLELAAALKRDWTVVILRQQHPETGLGFRTLSGLSARGMGAACAAADMIVSGDTAAFHWGGILGVPTVGLFATNDGATYCKYYPSATFVQCCDTPCIETKYQRCEKQYPGSLPVVPQLGVGLSKCFHPGSVLQAAETVRSQAAACLASMVRRG